MSYRDRECPRNPRDAYWEGQRAREYDRNPYQHGRDPFADRDCRKAHDEWARGQRAAEYRREEEAEQRRQEERCLERRRHEREQEHRWEQERLEQLEREQFEQGDCSSNEAEVKP